MKSRTVLLGCCGLAVAQAMAADPGTALPPSRTAAATSLTLESCVSHEAIVVDGQDLRVALDEGDRTSVFEQMLDRYPVLAHDGVVPSQIVLWRQPSGTWLYVTLLEHPRQPGQVCFTATFTARSLDITTALLRKYFAWHSAGLAR